MHGVARLASELARIANIRPKLMRSVPRACSAWQPDCHLACFFRAAGLYVQYSTCRTMARLRRRSTGHYRFPYACLSSRFFCLLLRTEAWYDEIAGFSLRLLSFRLTAHTVLCCTYSMYCTSVPMLSRFCNPCLLQDRSS